MVRVWRPHLGEPWGPAATDGGRFPNSPNQRLDQPLAGFNRMDAGTQAVVQTPTAASPDRTPVEDADGLNGAVTALLSRRGIIPAKAAPASAEAAPAAEVDDLSQSQPPENADGSDSPESGAAQDPEADDASPADEGEDEGEGESSEPSRVQKRINKLTARLKTAEEKAAAAEAELTKLKSGPATETPVDGDAELQPLLTAHKRYQDEIQLATQLRAKLTQSPNEVAEVIRKVAKDLPNYDPETLRDFLNDYIADAKREMGKTEGQIEERRGEQQRKSAQRRQQVMSLATDEMPWLRDESDARTKRFRELLDTPAVKGTPDAAFFVAAGLEKLAAMEARAKVRKPEAKPAARSTVRPSSSGHGAPAKVVAKNPLEAARAELGKGDRGGLLAYAKAAVAAADS